MSVVDEDDSIAVYPVFNKNGAQVDTVKDGYHIKVDTDKECVKVLHQIRASPNLSKRELALIDLCLNTIATPIGGTIAYGPGEVLEMLHMAESHQDLRFEIRACSHHIMHSLNFQMEDIDTDAAVKIIETAFKGNLALSDAFGEAIRAGSMNFGESDEDTLTDDDLLGDDDDSDSDALDCDCDCACEDPADSQTPTSKDA
jgi:hypothetical protein